VRDETTDQERFVHVLERRRLLSYDHRQGPEPDRTALVLDDQRLEQPPVHLVEPALVHLQHAQRFARHRQ
jgi:hypothetical protein